MPDDNGMFRAMIWEAPEETNPRLKWVAMTDLPPGDVLVRVAYSSLNYKDSLALCNKGKIIRRYPMILGIDYAGTIEESDSPLYKKGDRVILTGWGAGETTWGGYAAYSRVPAQWLIPMPELMEMSQAMAIGTAGLTAMLCILALEQQGITPDCGDVAVTGATGGVGSLAIALLAARGYRVTAITGKTGHAKELLELGASQVIGRDEIAASARKQLQSERWAAAIDTVGGAILAGLLSSVQYGGCIAACGMAGGVELNSTVFPFILRNVHLIGIDSVYCSYERRVQAWSHLAYELPGAVLRRITKVIPLSQVAEYAQTMIKGTTLGRMVVDVHA